nr:MAG TPA: hypothetical protein [Bacteriophage sp.]
MAHGSLACCRRRGPCKKRPADRVKILIYPPLREGR